MSLPLTAFGTDGPSETNPPFVVVGARVSTLSSLMPLADRLGALRRCYLVHQPDPRTADGKRVPSQVHEFADALASTLTGASLAPAVLVGHGPGLRVALEVFRRHRRCVAALVSLAGPARAVRAKWPRQVLTRATRGLGAALLRVAGDRVPRAVEAAGRRADLHRDSTTTAWLRDRADFARSLAHIDPRAELELARSFDHHSALDVLPHVDVPALVIGGDKDRYAPLWALREVAFSLPHAQWEVIVDADHDFVATHLDEVVARIQKFAETERPPT